MKKIFLVGIIPFMILSHDVLLPTDKVEKVSESFSLIEKGIIWQNRIGHYEDGNVSYYAQIMGTCLIKHCLKKTKGNYYSEKIYSNGSIEKMNISQMESLKEYIKWQEIFKPDTGIWLRGSFIW